MKDRPTYKILFNAGQQGKLRLSLEVRPTLNENRTKSHMIMTPTVRDHSSHRETWRSKFTAHATVSGIVDGASDPTVVANKFAEVFEVACSNNSVLQNNKLLNEFLTHLMSIHIVRFMCIMIFMLSLLLCVLVNLSLVRPLVYMVRRLNIYFMLTNCSVPICVNYSVSFLGMVMYLTVLVKVLLFRW